jgi:hypothetical protein
MRNNYAFVAKNGGANTGVTLTGPLQGGPSLVCMTYRFVADGTSILSGYTNGSLSQSVSNAVGPVQTSLTEYVVGREEWGGTSMSGNMFGAFYVDQELTSAQIAAISRRVLADVPKAVIRGGQSYVDMTYTRTGSRFCAKADNTGSIVPANRPCISQSGYLSEAAATNLVLRSQEFENAIWLIEQTGGPVTRTANYGLAPDSTKTAERFQFSATTSVGQSDVYIASLGTGTPHTFSFYVLSLAGDAVVPIYMNTGAPSLTYCSVNASTWTRCTRTGTPVNAFVGFGNWSNVSGTSLPALDLLVWGAQGETGSVATSYVPTTSAAASRGADNAYLTLTDMPLPTSFSLGLTLGAFTVDTTQFLNYLAIGSSLTSSWRNGYGLATDSAASVVKSPVLDASESGAYAGDVAFPALPFGAVFRASSGGLSLTAGSTTGTTTAFPAGTFARPGYLYLGGAFGTRHPKRALLSKICLDPSPSRCR